MPLEKLGSEAATAVPRVLELVEKGHADANVAWALWRIARRREAVSVLIAELDDVYEEELLFVLQALSEIGPQAREAGPALLVLRHGSRATRSNGSTCGVTGKQPRPNQAGRQQGTI